MKTESQPKITIPKPCHENWDEMTPNEKGAFCAKCCKTVVDFTKKSIEEIVQHIEERKNEKVCGRFENEQVSSPAVINFKIPISLLPTNISIRKAFAIAAFLVFGVGLFSCSTHTGRTMGEISVIDTPTVGTTPSIATEKLMGDTVIVVEPMTKGEVQIDTTPIAHPKMGKVKIE
ncbi:MAG: hypothetical protein J0L87_09800 [Bacteroidetes bacterium]|nr:hypothetical protein [Bacteroidota bacterium]